MLNGVIGYVRVVTPLQVTISIDLNESPQCRDLEVLSAAVKAECAKYPKIVEFNIFTRGNDEVLVALFGNVNASGIARFL